MARKTQALVRDGWRLVERSGKALAGWSVFPTLRQLRSGLGPGMLDLLFPADCVSCGAELATETRTGDDVPICAACFDELKLFDGPTCRRCGAPLARVEPMVASERGGCFHCAGRKLWFDATIAAGRYSGSLRRLLLRMKHREGEAVSLVMGRLMAQLRHEELAKLEVDVVVSVPMHWRRRLAHGTNSAAILAEVLAGRLSVPLAERLLRRNRHTPPQFSLTPPQRWNNVRRAFSVRAGYRLHNAHVLLVDDILTTGATCSEAARSLRKAGAKRVTVVVVARSVSP